MNILQNNDRHNTINKWYNNNKINTYTAMPFWNEMNNILGFMIGFNIKHALQVGLQIR